jgi:hypothetical protein
MAKINQRIQVTLGNQIHIATITTITTIGATKLNVLFAAEAHTTIATITRLDTDYYFINKLHIVSTLGQYCPYTRKAPTGGAFTQIVLRRKFLSRATFNRLDAYKLAVFSAFLLENHYAVCLGEQGMVFTDTNVLTGVEARATLTYQNIASQNELTTKAFYAKPFRF